jgi:hypothetical protein
MAYSPPAGNAVNFDLPMATAGGGGVLKRPVAFYDGRLKELQAGDSLYGFLKGWLIKNAAYNLANGDRIFADTSAGAFALTLPASPTFGHVVTVSDYKKTFATNNLTINRNGQEIDNVASNLVLNTNGATVELTYSGTDSGWITTVRVT